MTRFIVPAFFFSCLALGVFSCTVPQERNPDEFPSLNPTALSCDVA